REPRAARALRRLYELVDERAFALVDDPLAREELTEAVAGTLVIRLHPRAAGDAFVLDEGELAQLARHRLDLLGAFVRPPPGGGVRSSARHGVWAYRFGEERPARGGPPGFWEVVDRAPVTRSALLAYAGEGGARVLYESWSATDPVSVRRGRASCYWK